MQQAKKSNKFACVRCGAKQTLQKVYAVSTNAKDCRAVCAKLNMAVGEAEEEMLAAKAMQDLTGAAPAARQQQQQQQQGQGQQRPAAVPSWEQFMEGCEDEDAEDAMGSVPGQQGGGGGNGRFVTEVADGRLKRQGGARRKAASSDDGSDVAGEGAAACFSRRAGYGAAPPAPSAAGCAAYHAAPTAPPAAGCAGYGAARSALPAAGRAGFRAAPTAPPAAAASGLHGDAYKAMATSVSAAQHARPCKQPRTGATPGAPFEGQQTYQLAHRQPPQQQPQQHLQQQQPQQQYPGQPCNISAQEQHLRPFQQQHQTLQPWQHKWQQQQQQRQAHVPAPNGHAPAAHAHGTVPMHVGHAGWGTEPQQLQLCGNLARTWNDTQRAPDQGTAMGGQGAAMGNQGAAKGASWGTSPAANSANIAVTAKPSQNAHVGAAASKGALHKAAAPSAKWGGFVDEGEEDVPECVGDGLYVT